MFQWCTSTFIKYFSPVVFHLISSLSTVIEKLVSLALAMQNSSLFKTTPDKSKKNTKTSMSTIFLALNIPKFKNVLTTFFILSQNLELLLVEYSTHWWFDQIKYQCELITILLNRIDTSFEKLKTSLWLFISLS